MVTDRRTMLAGALVAGIASTALPGKLAAATLASRHFPKGFLWGAATAGHQVEGNNVASDLWLAERVKPTLFQQPSGDTVNSFELWPADLDLARSFGLNSYRFSLEWARIEPEPGQFSAAMLDHYARVIEGCHARGLTPIVTFCHFTVPRWFAARGGWSSPDAADLFARYCDRAARRLAAGMGYATTLNEPNAIDIMADVLPPQMMGAIAAMNAAAGKACGSEHFRNGMLIEGGDIETARAAQLAAHKNGRAAIKAARSNLPVGVSLAISDDQAVGANSLRDSKRAKYYGVWLDAAKHDDFIGVQNYARSQWTDKGSLPAPPGAVLSQMGAEVYAPSLAGSVRYAHEATGLPVLVTEHGVGTDDDRIRAGLIPAALRDLHKAVADGVPVLGYVHWSLLDNYEWIFGYSKSYGLCSVDRATFKRTPKPSTSVLRRIALANAV